MNNELKNDLEKLAKMTFEIAKKHGVYLSAYCCEISGEYQFSSVTYGKQLNTCLFWGDENVVEFKEGKDANIQTEEEA